MSFLNKFLEQVSCVKAIRNTATELTLYIVSLQEFREYEYVKRVVDKGDFSGLDSDYNRKHFGIEISDKLFSWFKTTSWIRSVARYVVGLQHFTG